MTETSKENLRALAPRHPRVAAFKNVEDFRTHLSSLDVEFGCDDEILQAPESPLAQVCQIGDKCVGNRFAIQPMEGWDGTEDGMPTDYVRRRWRNFGRSGAKLLWGGEAFAVCPEGRANPNQLMACKSTREGIRELFEITIAAHHERYGMIDDLMLGLQLTH